MGFVVSGSLQRDFAIRTDIEFTGIRSGQTPRHRIARIRIDRCRDVDHGIECSVFGHRRGHAGGNRRRFVDVGHCQRHFLDGRLPDLVRRHDLEAVAVLGLVVGGSLQRHLAIRADVEFSGIRPRQAPRNLVARIRIAAHRRVNHRSRRSIFGHRRAASRGDGRRIVAASNGDGDGMGRRPVITPDRQPVAHGLSCYQRV